MGSEAYTVMSLGTMVTYKPEEVFEDLLAHTGHTDNVQLVTELYRELGHHIEPSQAKGCIQLLEAGKHVPNIILQAWLNLG